MTTGRRAGLAPYATGTDVPVERSRLEVERILERYGASAFAYGWENDQVVIGFKAHARAIRFLLPMPTDKDVERTAEGRQRHQAAARATALQAEQRRRWRALALVLKAKLEAVASGIVSFEDEFLAHMVLPNGRTVGTWVQPQLERVLSTGKVPQLLTFGEDDHG